MKRLIIVLFLGVMAGCASQSRQSYKLQGRLITVHTEPEGARVYHIAPPTGTRVDLGMTPLVNQNVMVLTGVKETFTDPSRVAQLGAQMNTARLHIEKEGFQPYDLSMTTNPKTVTERTVKLEPVKQ